MQGFNSVVNKLKNKKGGRQVSSLLYSDFENLRNIDCLTSILFVKHETICCETNCLTSFLISGMLSFVLNEPAKSKLSPFTLAKRTSHCHTIQACRLWLSHRIQRIK